MKKYKNKRKPKSSQIATLTFDLNDIDAYYDFNTCLKAQRLSSTLHEVAQLLRKYRKYHTFETEAETKLINLIEEEFYNICKDHDIDPM